MSKFHILVVDDEVELVELVSKYLQKEGYDVSIAHNGFEALAIIDHQIDCILLDIMMPFMDGLTACEEIRKYYTTPIIFLTAKGDEDDKITGLRSGADDYLVKPFSLRELTARIDAVLRRSNMATKKNNVWMMNEIEINKDARMVRVGKEEINLTRKEYDLLFFLIEHNGQVLTREQIHDHVWGIDHDVGSLRTVDTHIKTLRVKLGSAGVYIKTSWGVGYKFES